MTDFSIGEAYGAGFRIIKRAPLAPLAWGLAYFTIAVLPIMLLMASIAPSLAESFREAARAGPGAAVAPPPGFGAIFMLQPILLISSIVSRAMLVAAVYRATLQPDNSRWCYLRLGMDELWVGLVALCMQFLLGIVMVVLLFPVFFGGIFAVIGAAAGPNPQFSSIAGVLPVILVFGLLALAVIIWLALRFSLALPMTFATGQFRLFESWTATKGRTGALFVLGLLQTLTLLAVEAIFLGVAAIVVVSAIGAKVGAGGLSGYFDQPVAIWLPTIMFVCITVGLIGTMLSGYVFAFVLAPWADVWRQLTQHAPADHFGPAPSTAPLG